MVRDIFGWGNVTTGAFVGPEMKLAVRYTGFDADRGRMSALEIGPAILGIGEMVGQTSRLLYGDAARVRVEVRADFAHASFGIEFYAVATVGDLLASLSMAELANICVILGFGGAATAGGIKGIAALLRWQRRRKIDKAERVGDEVRLTIQDQSLNVTVNEYKVFIDPEIRKGLRSVVAPLEREGVDSVQIRAGDDLPLEITKQEREQFAASPLPDDEVSIDRATATLEIVAPVFREGQKWRFAQGGNPFYALIADEDFLALVAKHIETFGSGDALRVEMEVRTTRGAEGLEYERTILKVLQHIPADRSRQLPLG